MANLAILAIPSLLSQHGSNQRLLNDEPLAVRLPFQDHEIVSFSVAGAAVGKAGEGLAKFAAIVGQVAGKFAVDAVKGEIAGKGPK
jgi:uncharacterized protein YcfJ